MNTENTNTEVETNDGQTSSNEQSTAQPMKTIYYSDNEVPFAVFLMPTTVAFPAEKYPLTATAPDPSIKSPKFDWNKHVWFENNAQAQSEKINNIIDDVAKLKDDQETTAQNKVQTDQKIDQVLKLMTLTSKQVGAISKQIATNNNNGGAQ